MALLISIFLIKEPVFFNIVPLIPQALIVSLYFFFLFRFTLNATHQIKFFLHPKRNKDRKIWGNTSCCPENKSLGCSFSKYFFKRCHDGIGYEHVHSSGQQMSLWLEEHPFCGLMKIGSKSKHNQNFQPKFYKNFTQASNTCSSTQKLFHWKLKTPFKENLIWKMDCC